MVDQAQVAEVTKSIFTFADSDGSGALDRDEFKLALGKMIAEHGMSPLTDEQFDQEFTGLDVDGNGLIDENELKALVARLLSA